MDPLNFPISLIICTKDRPSDLTRLLQSIAGQTSAPNKILVIDGSDNPIKYVVEEFRELPIEYAAVRPPSLPKQRNVGISKLTEEDLRGWVGFLDDDLELFDDALESLRQFIAGESQIGERPLGGVGLTIDEPFIEYSKLKTLCFLDRFPGGRFTVSGHPSPLRKLPEDLDVEWLRGGATFWRGEVLQNYNYDEWFEGAGYYEDVDFSYKVGDRYRLAMSAKSLCYHHEHPVGVEKYFSLGVWEFTAWWYFIKKAKNFSSVLALWGMVVLTTHKLAIGFLRPKSEKWRRGLGNLKGLWLIISGKGLERRSFFK